MLEDIEATKAKPADKPYKLADERLTCSSWPRLSRDNWLNPVLKNSNAFNPLDKKSISTFNADIAFFIARRRRLISA